MANMSECIHVGFVDCKGDEGEIYFQACKKNNPTAMQLYSTLELFHLGVFSVWATLLG